jgi:hypothetical protein
MIKRILKWFGALLLLVLLVGAGLGLHTWYAKPLNIEWF